MKKLSICITVLFMFAINSIVGVSANQSGMSNLFNQTKEELRQVQNYSELQNILKQKQHIYKVEEERRMYETSECDVAAPTSNYSETNIQVAGVEEADIVKTDNRYIYTCINEKKVVILDTFVNMKQVACIDYSKKEDSTKYYVKKIFLDKKYLTVVLTSGTSGGECEIWPGNNTKQYSIVQVYDINDKARPVLKREIQIEGELSEVRKIENRVYVVTEKNVGYFEENKFTPNDILPTYKDSEVGDKLQVVNLKRIRYYDWSECNMYTLIGSFNIDNYSEPITLNGILADDEDLYMNKEAIYLTATCYEESRKTNMCSTYIAKYTVQNENVKYTAYSKVQGELLNQFSMDEYEGYFRIATSAGDINDGNNVYILDKYLNVISKLEGLAKGERIYSVRFDGGRGYVVTFKEIDPLFVIDLSKPDAPKVLGKLKVPGFSQYLHPIGDNLVIGIGRSTALNVERDEEGNEKMLGTMATGVKVSLFNVANPNLPVEINSIILGNYGYSEALEDHKAVMVDEARKIIAIPVRLYFNDLVEITETINGMNFSGACVFAVENGKLASKAKLGQLDANTKDYKSYYEDGSGRIFYIGDNMYYMYGNHINKYDKNTFECKTSIILN